MGMLKLFLMGLTVAILTVAHIWSKLVRTLFWLLPRALFTMVVSYQVRRSGTITMALFFSAIASIAVVQFISVNHKTHVPIANYINRLSDLSEDMFNLVVKEDEHSDIEYITNEQFKALAPSVQNQLMVEIRSPEVARLQKHADGMSMKKVYLPWSNDHTTPPTDDVLRWQAYFERQLSFEQSPSDKIYGIKGNFKQRYTTDPMSAMYPFEKPLGQRHDVSLYTPKFGYIILLIVLVVSVISAYIFNRMFRLATQHIL